MTVKCVALYCRISKDKTGRVEGVRRQEEWGRAYAEKHWPGIPVRVFSDNDKSAVDGSAPRPGFEALREALAQGEVAHLWVVEQSRLERDTEGFYRLGRQLRAAGLEVFHTNREGVVLAESLGARIKAVVNADEVERNRVRLMDTLEENAGRGVASGASPFGYSRGANERGDRTYVVVEAAAELIRECADLVLAGHSLTSIAADLNARICKVCPESEPEHTMHGPLRQKVINHECGGRQRKCECPPVTLDGRPVEDGGVPVTRRSTITGQTVKGWVTNATVAGHRVHQKKDLGPGTGNWTAILDEDTWTAVRHTLAAPRRVQRSDGGTYPVTPTTRATGRRYLLTGGIAVCGVCGAPLQGSMKQLWTKRADGTWVLLGHEPYYGCHPKLGGKACVSIKGKAFEDRVVELLFERSGDPDFRAALESDPHATRRAEIEKEIARLGGKLDEYQDQFDDDLIDRRKLDERTRKLNLRQSELQAEKAALPLPPTGERIEWETLRDDWGDLTLDERRHYLSLTIRSVAVNRAAARGGGRGGIDLGRIGVPEWVPGNP